MPCCHANIQTNAVFEFHVKNAGGKELVQTIDLKKDATVYEGPAKGKADCIINLGDDTFADLADGKLNGQKAFMSGKLKVKGNIMLATKLDGVLNAQRVRTMLSTLTCSRRRNRFRDNLSNLNNIVLVECLLLR